jgi:hypothetical protein
MSKIFKYKLKVTDMQVIALPAMHQILSAQVQRGEICVWARVWEDTPLVSKWFYIFGTGHAIADGIPMDFIDTVQMHDGSLIFHVFCGGNKHA